MTREELLKRCENVVEIFDGFEILTENLLKYPGTIYDFILEDVLRKEAQQYFGEDLEFGEEKNTVIEDLMDKLAHIHFALGYVIGQSFDSPYPEIQEDVEAIRKVLKEEKLLPYFPREKKAATPKHKKTA